MPDIALDRTEHGGAIRQKIVAAEEQKCVPRVGEWGLDRINDVGP